MFYFNMPSTSDTEPPNSVFPVDLRLQLLRFAVYPTHLQNRTTSARFLDLVLLEKLYLLYQTKESYEEPKKKHNDFFS